ncbi:MAG: hypothetical protein IKU47_08020 [Oscillospiraceae bacterium]|nr:hypothetical protein [Oscillospiraceae bacterium]
MSKEEKLIEAVAGLGELLKQKDEKIKDLEIWKDFYKKQVEELKKLNEERTAELQKHHRREVMERAGE